MPEHAVVVIPPDQRQDLLVIPKVVFLLRAPALEVLRSEFLVFHLMNGQNYEVEGVISKHDLSLSLN